MMKYLVNHSNGKEVEVEADRVEVLQGEGGEKVAFWQDNVIIAMFWMEPGTSFRQAGDGKKEDKKESKKQGKKEEKEKVGSEGN